MRFDSFHPAINLIFFVGVIAFAVMLDHPIALAVGWLCAFIYSIKLNGVRAVALNLVMVVVAVVFALFYAQFTHFGMTELGQNFIGNRYTLESLVVGCVIGIKLGIVVMWCSCLFAVFSVDKVVYLFGRLSPRLALMISVIVRMVPRVKGQGHRMNDAQKGIGRGLSQGSILRRLMNGMRILSSLIMWITEDSVAKSDSMRSRGVQLKHRTAFSFYRFDGRDRSFVIIMFACIALVIAGIMLNQMNILYNPEIIMNRITPLSSVFFVAYALFCLLPCIAQLISEYRFKHALNKLSV